MSNPWMPLYIADYLGDTQHLTTEQHGAYLLLLMTMWTHGGSLPNEPKLLSRIAKVSLRRWHLLAPVVMRFFDVEGNRVAQKRLELEHQKAVSISAKRSAAARERHDQKVDPFRTKRSHKKVAPLRIENSDKPLENLESTSANGHAKPYAKRRYARGYHNHIEDLAEAKPSNIDPPDGGSLALGKRALKTEFSQWYKIYPVKRSRGDAEQAFAAARKIASLDELVNGVRRYQATKRADRDFQYPATWLRGKGWLDEPEPSPPSRWPGTDPPAYPQEERTDKRFMAEQAKRLRNG